MHASELFLSPGVSSTTMTWNVMRLCQNLDHTYIRRSPKGHELMTEGSRARAHQRSFCHRFVPGGRLSLGPSTGVNLRAEALYSSCSTSHYSSSSSLQQLALRVITLREPQIRRFALRRASFYDSFANLKLLDQFYNFCKICFKLTNFLGLQLRVECME